MSAFDLTSKVVVVTGGAGLIGRGLVEGLAGSHAEVFVADVDLRAADELAARLRLDELSVSSIELDISDYDSISRCVNEVLAAAGSARCLGEQRLPEDCRDRKRLGGCVTGSVAGRRRRPPERI